MIPDPPYRMDDDGERRIAKWAATASEDERQLVGRVIRAVASTRWENLTYRQARNATEGPPGTLFVSQTLAQALALLMVPPNEDGVFSIGGITPVDAHLFDSDYIPDDLPADNGDV